MNADPKESRMRIYTLKKASLPKVAVLATGLTAALLAATIGPPAAQATPRAKNCAGCHAAGGSTTARPSTATPAAGAAYTVAISLAANPVGGNTGWAIVAVAPATGSAFGGNTSSALSYSATMTAPAAAGTYSYTVYTNQGGTDPDGQASSATYSITVAPVVTVPPTTVPPTTVPPTTVPPTTVPPTTVPPTTAPPVPPTSTARLRSLSPTHGVVGAKVTIRGSGFGKPGVVRFGTVVARASSWTSTSIVVRVPARSAFTMRLGSAAVPVWYLRAPSASVTVTPRGVSTSNALSFRLDSGEGDHEQEREAARHHEAARHTEAARHDDDR